MGIIIKSYFWLKSKIYSYRVDGLHTDTYKILGGLNRTEIEKEDS